MKEMKSLLIKLLYILGMMFIMFLLGAHLHHSGLSNSSLALALFYTIILAIIMYIRGYIDKDTLDEIFRNSSKKFNDYE